MTENEQALKIKVEVLRQALRSIYIVVTGTSYPDAAVAIATIKKLTEDALYEPSDDQSGGHGRQI